MEAELEVLSEAARIGVPVFKADSPDVKWSTEGVLNFDSGGLTESFDLQVSEKLLISLGMPGSKVHKGWKIFNIDELSNQTLFRT